MVVLASITMSAESANPILRRQLTTFFGLTYAIAWLFFGALALSQAGLGWLPWNLSVPVMIVLGSCAPALSAFLTLRLTERRWPAVAPLTRRSLFVGLIIAPILIAATFAAAPAAILTVGPPSSL